METYEAMMYRHQKEVNNFPIGVAFNEKQFKEMMEKWGLTENDTDQIVSVNSGWFVRKKDMTAFNEMFTRIEEEEKAAIENDETGEGYIYQMFLYELRNHEYSYTGDITETLDALGYTVDDIRADKKLLNGFIKAQKEAMKEE